GDIVAAGLRDVGASNYDFLVARFDPEYGQHDYDFGDNGPGYTTIKFDSGGDNFDSAEALTIFADGSVLAAGYTALGNFQYRAAVAKLKNDGTPDLTWNGTG